MIKTRHHHLRTILYHFGIHRQMHHRDGIGVVCTMRGSLFSWSKIKTELSMKRTTQLYVFVQLLGSLLASRVVNENNEAKASCCVYHAFYPIDVECQIWNAPAKAIKQNAECSPLSSRKVKTRNSGSLNCFYQQQKKKQPQNRSRVAKIQKRLSRHQKILPCSLLYWSYLQWQWPRRHYWLAAVRSSSYDLNYYNYDGNDDFDASARVDKNAEERAL